MDTIHNGLKLKINSEGMLLFYAFFSGSVNLTIFPGSNLKIDLLLNTARSTGYNLSSNLTFLSGLI